MKKIILSIIALIVVVFLIPVLLTTKFENTNTEEQTEEGISSISTYNYEEYNNIQLLHAKTGEIEELNIDEYLYRVVSAEIPSSFELEAIKAQAIAARTYTIYKIKNNDGKHGAIGICDNSTCCQAYISKEDRLAKWSEEERQKNWDKIVQAVDTTKGKIITYNNEPINAFFHANSGGVTEIPTNVWVRK